MEVQTMALLDVIDQVAATPGSGKGRT